MLFSFKLELFRAIFSQKIRSQKLAKVRLTPYQKAKFLPKMAIF